MSTRASKGREEASARRDVEAVVHDEEALGVATARRLTGMHLNERAWPLEIVFTENDRATRADIVLDVGGHHYHGWGRARRSPSDPDVPRIGEEVAAGRALSRLAEQLLGAAADDIEAFEHHPVNVHP